MTPEKPIRVKRTYTQHLSGTPQAVFPLLCPVREIEWVNGWNPDRVISDSGIAELHCIFTIGENDGAESTWVVTAYDPLEWKIDFLKIVPHTTVAHIEIKLELSGNRTLAHISYAYTALSEKGAEFVKEFTEAYYRDFMKTWEAELNNFLETGQKLPR